MKLRPQLACSLGHCRGLAAVAGTLWGSRVCVSTMRCIRRCVPSQSWGWSRFFLVKAYSKLRRRQRSPCTFSSWHDRMYCHCQVEVVLSSCESSRDVAGATAAQRQHLQREPSFRRSVSCFCVLWKHWWRAVHRNAPAYLGCNIVLLLLLLLLLLPPLQPTSTVHRYPNSSRTIAINKYP